VTIRLPRKIRRILAAIHHMGSPLTGADLMRITCYGPGAIYPSLERLERNGWIERAPGPKAVPTYRLTAHGRQHAGLPEQSSRTTPDNPPTSSAWTPPPPGDRREQLPDAILALLDIPSYTSTACETAELLAAAITRHPAHADELRQWEQRQRQRCRINNKYTGVNCQHLEAEDAIPPA
jgi:hypothetical protein